MSEEPSKENDTKEVEQGKNIQFWIKSIIEISTDLICSHI